MTDTEGRTLEQRITEIEDRLAIYNLLATHPLSADTGEGIFVNSIYAEDAIFDRGPNLPGAKGRDAMYALVQSAAHKEAISGGLTHFGNLPLVELKGDKASATSYIMIITPDHGAEAKELANHGSSSGYRIHRTIANRWELEKIEGKWQIKSRRLVFHDGSEEVQDLIRQAGSYYE